MTLRMRLTVAFVLVVLVPLVVGAALVTRLVPASVEARQQAGLADTARAAGLVLSGSCRQVQTAAFAVGRASAGLGPKDIRAALQPLVATGMADGVRVLDAGGRLVGELGTLPRELVDCGSGRAPAEPYLTGVFVLQTAGGSAAGTAVAVRRIDEAFVTDLAEGTRKEAVAVYAGDRLVAATGPVDADLLSLARAAGGTAVTSDGDTAVFRRPAGDQPFGLLVVEQAAAGPGVLPVALLVVLGAVGLAAAIALLLARTTTRPLEELGAAAARIAGGDLSTTIDVRSRDEVGRLAGAFNTMTEELRTYVGALEASRDELHAGMLRLGETLSGTHDLDRILAVVLETAMSSTGAQAGMVLLLTPDRSELELRVARGMEERGITAPLTLPVGSGLSGRVAETGEPVRGQLGTGPGDLEPGPGEPSSGSAICVPLRASGRVLGVLHLYDRTGATAFDDVDLGTIRTFTAQATVAVQNVLLHQEAQRLSITDALTGLHNYRYFTMTIGKEIERAARFGRPLSLLMLDLDHFKAVNDTYGHPRGDAVLVELAGRVKGQVRDVDTVARYGGEEIVVILPETDEEGARHAAERICDAVRRRPFGGPDLEPVEVTVSVGAAVFPTHGGSSSALLRRADQALYDAKHAGRDTWRVAGPLLSALPDERPGPRAARPPGKRRDDGTGGRAGR